LDTLQTRRNELDKIVRDLKEARFLSGKKSREARMHEMTIEELEENDAPESEIEAIRKEIDLANKTQLDAEERAENLKAQLIEKSRAENSLPEFELVLIVQNRGTSRKSMMLTALHIPEEKEEISIRNWIVEKEITSGSQAKVFLCHSTTDTKTKVVIKAYAMRESSIELEG
jgi:hypothetical protein